MKLINYIRTQITQNRNQIMKASATIQRIMNNRLQFLQSLFELSSYQDIIITSDVKLTQRHQQMQRQQTQAVSIILSTIRIDQIFKRQFHKIVLKVFKKVQPRVNLRNAPTGSYKDILSDYSLFFHQLNQTNILNFLRQIFQLQIYNQTTTIYVLVQLLIKFLRIKCKTFINERIIKVKEKANKFDHFSEFMKLGIRASSKNQCKNRQRKSSSKLSKESQKSINLKTREEGSLEFKLNSVKITQHSQTISVEKPKKDSNTRRFLRSASFKNKSIIHSPRLSGSQRPQRRIIKSYKDIFEQRKEKIQVNNQSLLNCVKQQSFNPSKQLYHKLFVIKFQHQWQIYLYLIGMEDIQPYFWNQRKSSEQNNLGSSENACTNKKGLWLMKNKQKIIVQACARNDQIRRQMEEYSENYRKV